MKKQFIIIGGGAAGYFAAINAAEMHPDLEVIILEGSGNVLQKVKISSVKISAIKIAWHC